MSIKLLPLAAMLVLSIGAGAQEHMKGLANPERGFRFEILVGQESSEKEIPTETDWPFEKYRSEGFTITQAYCYLSDYWQKPLSQAKLDALQKSFDRARKDGVKFLLRFAYEGGVNKEAKPSLERILSHIEQLTPIVRKNSDVIYVLQIGWIGLWGEFHSDPIGLDKDPKAVAAVVKATLDMLPESRKTMMRCMRYQDMAVQGAGGKFTIDTTRIGFFNDGTLAGASDGGTFLPDREAWEALMADDGNSEFDRVTAMDKGIPVDGELFWSTYSNRYRGNAIAALDRFIKHHYSTFSIVHSHIEFDGEGGGVIDSWKATPFNAQMLKAIGFPCDENYFAEYPQPSAYEYIRDHFGYRLEVTGADLTQDKKSISGNVTIRNTGFASPINPRLIYLVLTDDAGDVLEIPTGFNAQILEPWEELAIPVFADIPAKFRKAGGVKLALWLPDEDDRLHYRPEYAVSIAHGTERMDIGGRLLNVINR